MATKELQAASNTISGMILEKETGRGIGKILVELFDLDAWPDLRSRRVAGPRGQGS
jgi:hypothetical protein